MRSDGGGTWYRLALRVAATAAIGAAIGLGVSKDLDWSTRASLHECAQSSGLCFGVSPVIGLAWGLIGTVLACWIGFAVADLRPLPITVPSGVIVLLIVTVGYLQSVPGGRLHPAWAYVLVAALSMAMLALTVITQRGLAGAATLAILVIAALFTGRALHDHLRASEAQHALTSLHLPLLAPHVPGYRLQSAYADGSVLTLNLTASGSTASPANATGHWFEIVIAPVPAGFSPPGYCMDVQPAPTILAGDGPAPCVPAGPDRWTRHGGDVVQLIERRGNALIEVSGSLTSVGLPTLTRALDSLRPTTAAALIEAR
jgi:hypothetical protein